MVYSDHLELFVIFVITKSCNLSLLWVSAEVIVFVGIPLSVEVIEVGVLVLCLSLLVKRRFVV